MWPEVMCGAGPDWSATSKLKVKVLGAEPVCGQGTTLLSPVVRSMRTQV